jgi:putative phosphoribosyl transferase
MLPPVFAPRANVPKGEWEPIVITKIENRFEEIRAGGITLPGTLTLPPGARGLVVFVHGSGSSRLSPRNQRVAEHLQKAGLGTLLFDLLSQSEEQIDRETAALRFNIDLLAGRTVDVVDWLLLQDFGKDIQLGFFGASTGASAALVAAARRPKVTGAVVSRGGRPDLAGQLLPKIQAPTLLIVGKLDDEVLRLNEQALEQLPEGVPKELRVVPGATHLFEEPGKMDEVIRLAHDWFIRYLGQAPSDGAKTAD